MRRVEKNRAIVAIARILIETVFSMLSTGHEFIDNIDSLKGHILTDLDPIPFIRSYVSRTAITYDSMIYSEKGIPF
ncbi:MAG: hypothetical protein QW046_05520 [Candidatus Micrarchaeaceae archaeon]